MQISIFIYFKERDRRRPTFPGSGCGDFSANWHDGCRKTPRIRMNRTWTRDLYLLFFEKKQVGRERHFHDSFILHIIRILSRMDRCMIVDLYKGSAWVEIYTSAPSRVIAFKQVDISGPFDLVTNRIGAMPSSAGKRQAECQFSAFVSVSLEL